MASKASLISGSSDNKVANDLLKIQARAECDLSLPYSLSVQNDFSHSNIADLPSCELLEFLPEWPKAAVAKVSDLQEQESSAEPLPFQ